MDDISLTQIGVLDFGPIATHMGFWSYSQTAVDTHGPEIGRDRSSSQKSRLDTWIDQMGRFMTSAHRRVSLLVLAWLHPKLYAE